MFKGGCSPHEFRRFTHQWNLYAESPGEIHERELRQELLNCAEGPFEDVMYDTLGTKVDSLSEADLLYELEILATLKTDTEGQAENQSVMINNTGSTQLQSKSSRNLMMQQPEVPEAQHPRNQKFQLTTLQKPKIRQSRFQISKSSEDCIPEDQAVYSRNLEYNLTKHQEYKIPSKFQKNELCEDSVPEALEDRT